MIKKCNNLILFISLITGIAAVVATITTVVIFNDKKRREDEELERYLDNSIL
jgi:hypothetical protein